MTKHITNLRRPIQIHTQPMESFKPTQQNIKQSIQNKKTKHKNKYENIKYE